MFKFYVYAVKATLSDYLTMLDFLAKKDVDRGFVVYDHGSYTACMGVQLHEDSDVNMTELLPQYHCIFGDVGIDNDDLDQPFRLEEGLFLAMLNSDLVQTKNLANERAAFVKRLGLDLDGDRTVINR